MASQITVTAQGLAKELLTNNVSVLIGSGVSCACGLPSWKALIDDMKRSLRQTCCAPPDRAQLTAFFRSSDATEIAGAFKRRVGSAAYIQFLRERFRHRPYVQAPLLKQVARLPVRVLFTTNFDKLLETVCRDDDGEDPVVITDPGQFTGLNGHERRIIKVHGDIDYPHTITLTDEDYVGYDDKCASIRAYLQGHIAFSQLILIGFGLKDPNFSRIYAGARNLVPGGNPRVIALMSNQNQWDVAKWQGSGLVINNFQTYDEVPRFLGRVIRDYNNGRP